MVYSALEALDIAAANPDRQVVFFAIGFETTTPASAHVILEAQRRGLANFSVYCNHVLTPSAIQSILDSPEVREWGQVRIDGFIGPSHVSTVIGSRPYEYLRRGISAASRDRRLRAARCHAGNPDAGATAQRGARGSRERVHARGDA